MNEHVSRVARTLAATAVALALSAAPSSIWASPPDQVWTEDLFLHPSGPAELGMLYGLAQPANDVAPSVDVVTLRTLAGFDRAPMEWSPSISFVNNFDGLGTQLFSVGLRARYRLLGNPSKPKIAVAFGYQLMLFAGHEHRLEQRLAGRVQSGQSVSLGWEVGLQEHFGNQTQVEGRISAAASVGMGLNYVRFSVETFALIPLKGERMTDFEVGEDSTRYAVYVGPGLRLNLEDYLWLNGSVVTGALVGYGAPVMVRVGVGTQF